MAKLMVKVNDLENRSKRKNVVFWNIPEGAEDDSTCEGIIKYILVNHMNLEWDIEIMRAHHTTIKIRQDRRNGERSSRPIHVALLRYPEKQFMLKKRRRKTQGQSISWRQNFYFR